MSRKSLGILAIAAGLLGLIALWLASSDDRARIPDGVGERLLPEFRNWAGAVTAIEIEGETRIVLRYDEGWKVENRSGYPANRQAVARLFAGLEKAERSAPKTADRAKFDRIGLGNGAISLTLFSADDEPLTSLLLGQRSFTGADETFVFKQDDARAWLVTGLPTIEADIAAWLDDELLDIDRARVASVRVTREGESPLIMVSREDADASFEIADLGGDEKAVPGAASTLATSIIFLSLDDVRPADDAPSGETVTTEWRMFDGLIIQATTTIVPGSKAEATPRYFTRLSARADGSAESDDGAQAIAAEANALNARWSGWAFEIPAYKGEDFTIARADLVQPRAEDTTPQQE